MRVGVVKVHREFLLCTSKTHTWSLDAKLLHSDHHGANELVPALKTEQLILPIGLIKEDDVKSDGMCLEDCSQFRENVLLVLTILLSDEFEETLAESIDLFDSSAKFDGYWNSFRETT